jgi:hypothetical protein
MVTAPDPSPFTKEKLRAIIEKEFQSGGRLDKKRGGWIRVNRRYEIAARDVMQEYRNAGWKVSGQRPHDDEGYKITFSPRR